MDLFIIFALFLFNYRDHKYIAFLKQLFEKNGIAELLFTSDGGKELVDGTLPGIFETVNFQNKVEENLDKLNKHQPGKNMFCFNEVHVVPRQVIITQGQKADPRTQIQNTDNHFYHIYSCFVLLSIHTHITSLIKYPNICNLLSCYNHIREKASRHHSLP